MISAKDSEQLCGVESGAGSESEVDRASMGREGTLSTLATKSKGKPRRSAVELGNPMDQFINPGSEAKCRRLSPRRYFGHWDSGGE